MVMVSKQKWEWAEPSGRHPGFSDESEAGEFWCLRCDGNAPEGVISILEAQARLLPEALAALKKMPHFLYIVDWFMGALAYGKHADESLGRRTNEWIQSDLNPMRKEIDALIANLQQAQDGGA